MIKYRPELGFVPMPPCSEFEQEINAASVFRYCLKHKSRLTARPSHCLTASPSLVIRILMSSCITVLISVIYDLIRTRDITVGEL